MGGAWGGGTKGVRALSKWARLDEKPGRVRAQEASEEQVSSRAWWGAFTWTEVAFTDLVHGVWMLAATYSPTGVRWAPTRREAGTSVTGESPSLASGGHGEGGGGGAGRRSGGWCAPVLENKS